MLRYKIMVCVAALLFGSLAITDVASADTIGDCCLTGYTFMGGQGPYTSTPTGSNAKNYFLAQPLSYDFNGTDMWGYAWTKFDNLGTSPVDSAYLVIDLLKVGGMVLADATEDYPGSFDIFNPGDIDVADLTTELSLRQSLKNDLLDSTSLTGTLVMSSNGTYCVDITDFYNGWIDGSIENHGLVFVSCSEASDSSSIGHGNVGVKLASFGNESGSAPYISSEIVGTLLSNDLPGDANRDGKVDGSDVTILAGNWQMGVPNGGVATWEDGDFNGDGKVDGSDVTILAGNWQYGVTAAVNAVPEPSTLVMVIALIVAMLPVAGRRRYF